MLNENELREYLAARRAGMPRPDLAERIILAMRATPQKRGLVAALAAQVGDFMLPRPAYSLTAALVLGLMIGLVVPLQMQVGSAMPLLPIDDDGAMP